jgi:hypothetical protein
MMFRLRRIEPIRREGVEWGLGLGRYFVFLTFGTVSNSKI